MAVQRVQPPLLYPKNTALHRYELTQHWNMDPLNMYILLKMGILRCDVSLPRGNRILWPFFGQDLFKPS